MSFFDLGPWAIYIIHGTYMYMYIYRAEIDFICPNFNTVYGNVKTVF